MEDVQGALGILERGESLRHTILLPGQEGTKCCIQTLPILCPEICAASLGGFGEAMPPGAQGLGVSYLNGSGGSRAAGPDLEEAGTGRGCLPTLTGGAAFIDDHGLPAKQAHEVGRLLALDHTALAGRQENKSGKWVHQSFCVALGQPPSQASTA